MRFVLISADMCWTGRVSPVYYKLLEKRFNGFVRSQRAFVRSVCRPALSPPVSLTSGDVDRCAGSDTDGDSGDDSAVTVTGTVKVHVTRDVRSDGGGGRLTLAEAGRA